MYKALQLTVQELFKTNHDVTFSGTTLNVVILIKRFVYVLNVGDSRAVLGTGRRYSEVIQLSVDHKPFLKEEKQRILKNHGRIFKIKDENGKGVGPLRVWLK